MFGIFRNRSIFASVVCLVFVQFLMSCSNQIPQSDTQGFWPLHEEEEKIAYSKAEDGRVIPEKVARFLHEAHRFGEGVRTYRLGNYQRSMTDCSGFLGQAHRSAGYGVVLYQFDYDFLNFTTCTGGVKPGDVLLLAYPGRQPDHWIMMADVKDPNGKFHSPKNVIMDVSSDYVDGRPYYRGELSRRQNLLARKVYACRRHRAFEREWKLLAQQIARQEAEAKSESRETPNQDEGESTNLKEGQEPNASSAASRPANPTGRVQ